MFFNFFPSSRKASLCARLHIRRSRQNTFYTITDLANKVVRPLSLGLLSTTRNKRMKRSSATLERVCLKIKAVLRSHSISSIVVLVRSRLPRWNVRLLRRMFSLQGIRVLAVENRRLAIHGHFRAQKSPRK